MMKNIQIKASQFFELLKASDTSMWEIFSQMIDGAEKEIIFLDDEEKVLFHYILPETMEKVSLSGVCGLPETIRSPASFV